MIQIIYPYDYWINSQLSIARLYGGCKVNGRMFNVMPPNGDLVRSDYSKYYNQLGSEQFLAILRANPDADEQELKAAYEEAYRISKREAIAKNNEQRRKQTLPL